MPKLRFLVTATALLAGGLLPACGDDEITEPESIFGLYGLVTVGGSSLPTDVGGVVYTAGFIQLNSDGTYSASLTIELFGELTDTGTFTVDGSTVDFIPSGGDLKDRFTATVSGNTLTLVEDGETFVFRK